MMTKTKGVRQFAGVTGTALIGVRALALLLVDSVCCVYVRYKSDWVSGHRTR